MRHDLACSSALDRCCKGKIMHRFGQAFASKQLGGAVGRGGREKFASPVEAKSPDQDSPVPHKSFRSAGRPNPQLWPRPKRECI
jgi:hypothetical protein